jgi:ElaB/YqjD/DUF883 family membrane-anchored ribosome-binding protein
MTDADIYQQGFDTDGALGAAPTGKVRAAAASAREAAASLKDAAASVVDEARHRARDYADDVVDRVQTRYGDVEAWVHQNPTRALGVAAGIGVVLGLLLRGRRTKVVYRGRAA